MQKKLCMGFSIIITLLLLSNAHMARSTQGFDAEQVALEFLRNVAAVDMDNHGIISINASTGRMPDSQHLQTNVRIVIRDNQRELETVLTFIDGRFWMFRMDVLSGNLGEDQQSLNEGLAAVNRVINEYRTRFNASYTSEFSSMISAASRTQSLKTETENYVLEIHHAETNPTSFEHTRATWFSKINSQFISPFRSIDVSLSKTGLLIQP